MDNWTLIGLNDNGKDRFFACKDVAHGFYINKLRTTGKNDADHQEDILSWFPPSELTIYWNAVFPMITYLFLWSPMNCTSNCEHCIESNINMDRIWGLSEDRSQTSIFSASKALQTSDYKRATVTFCRVVTIIISLLDMIELLPWGGGGVNGDNGDVWVCNWLI